jgi:type I restriction enzyme S subunit
VICNQDDILMTRTGNTGEVVTGVFGAFHNNFFKIAYSSNCSKWFLYYFLTSHKTQHTILKLAGTSTIPDLNHGDFYKIPINIPSLPEQQKIASFLSAVDKKIELLTRKKQLLQEYKKGVMQKIFSRKIRFKDNDGSPFPDWEDKRLGDIAEFFKGKGISKDDVEENGKIECIRYGELYTIYKEVISTIISKTNAISKDLMFSKKNDVLQPSSGETHADIATASCVSKDRIAIGGDINIIRSSQNGIFLAYYLNNKLKHKIASFAQGSSVIHLYPNHLKRLIISLPSINEQNKIAIFLSNMDTKVESIFNKIVTIKTFKNGLLQKMFV